MALTTIPIACYHCGEDCGDQPLEVQNKPFCCEGCSMVYSILAQNDLCRYYNITDYPGLSQRQTVRKDKFLFLDDEKVQQSLISFKDEDQTFITFYLPQIHCSSCLWLLENLHRVEPAVISAKVDFPRKEVEIFFDHHRFSIRRLAELLTSIGYEPYINLHQFLPGQVKQVDRSRLYKLGVAGFCFANSMLFSFPEYLGIDTQEHFLLQAFRLLNVVMSLPVFIYSASEFYGSAWKGLKHGFLNIDAPIVLAIIVTFGRSLFEVLTGTGSGYFDSMSGIVLFMLAGRVLQERTYNQLNFERDYTSYFPVAVTRLKEGAAQVITLPDIALNDTLLIHSEELIPADGIITRGRAMVDYSFVTGESVPVQKQVGELIYAGGKQVGGSIELLVIKEVAQSYLTRLWNREQGPKQVPEERSFVHLLSRHFTWILFTIALCTAGYWYLHNPAKIWGAVTAVLIVACPCALLLSNTFTNGNILRLLGRQRLYLRQVQVIEDLANADCIVFDKTGTLTDNSCQELRYEGEVLSADRQRSIASLAAQSNHPMSKAIVRWVQAPVNKPVTAFRELPGQGIEGLVAGNLIAIGSRRFVYRNKALAEESESAVYVSVEENPVGRFSFKNQYRPQVFALLQQLKKNYQLAVLSGDNNGEHRFLSQLLAPGAILRFNQGPEDKLRFIRHLQGAGRRVIMIGDGLNDAGALQQADVGIAVSDDANCFTPASDAILDAKQLPLLAKMIRLCKINKRIVMAAFCLSIGYNIVGLSFAVQGNLSPMIAAILMPASSLSILLVTFGASNLAARCLKK